MRVKKIWASAAAVALLAAVPLAAASPAAAITPRAALGTGAVGGYSTGSVIALEAVSAAPGTLANASVAQTAADVNVGREFVDEDLLGNAILFADEAARAGRNAYGHGSSANVGVGGPTNEPPQIAPVVAEALSPPPSGDVAENLLALPSNPVLTAELLPATAQARTTSVGSICPDGSEGTLISEGTAQAANAAALTVLPGVDASGSVVATSGVSSSISRTFLEGRGLVTETTQSVAPVSLFQGTPAQLDIEVIHLLQLRALATGGAGSELFYGFVDADTGERVPDSEPVLFVNGMGLTSEQVLGTDGLRLGLGVADVIIGAPAHGLDDNPNSDPTVTPTTVAGAADLIRVSIPGVLQVPALNPIGEDSPLADLNQVLNPVLEGLEPISAGLQEALAGAGITVADVRIGHFEALAAVPAGGLDPCAGDPNNPLRDAMKDVSTLSVAPGGTFDYTIRFSNLGDEDLTGVRVVDTFSASLEFVRSEGSVTPPEGQVRTIPAPQQDGNTLRFDVGTVEPGAFVVITLTFRVPENAANGTVFRNEATISATFRGEEIRQDVVAEGPTASDTFRGPCDVSRSTKFASDLQVRTGDQFAYFVNVSNTGAEPCTNVTITDDLGDGVEFVSCSDSCTVEGRRVTWRVGTLNGGSSTTVSVVVRATATQGTLPNTALIQTSEGSTARPSTPGPTISDVRQVAPGNPAGCPATGCPQGGQQPRGPLARTGTAEAVPALGALVLAGALLARRRGRADEV